jgi:twinkle protein
MSCVEKLPHICGTRDALQVFEEGGKYTGFCFACSTYIDDPYQDKPKDYKPVKITKSPEEIQEEIEEINSYPSVGIPSRKLTKDALSYYGVKVALSEADGVTPVAVYFPYHKDGKLVAYKARLLEKKTMWAIGNLKEADMFGWDRALDSGGKKLFITEGEFDTLALFIALTDRSKVNDIQSIFTEIVLVFDNDKVGQDAVKRVMQIIPKATSATLPSKDANQCLIDGRKRGLSDAVLFRSEAPKNTNLVWGRDLHEKAREPAQWGLSWPWEAMTKMTRGIRFGETYYLGAGVKMGKSEIVNSIAAHLIIEHNLKVFLAKPEEANNKSYKMVASKVAGRIFHDPEVEFDYEAFDKCKDILADKLCLVNLYQHLGWETLRKDILAAVGMGCKAVFIDPITNLTNGISSGDTNTILQSIAQDLSAMAKDLDICIFIFCHLKAPDAGPPHERGGKVQSHQFSGSRAMMRSCNYMIGIEGNKDPDLTKEEKNIRKIVILEDREFGNSGYFRLYWDDNTSLFNELKD